MPRNRGIEDRLNNWRWLVGERSDLREAVNPEAVEKAFTILYSSAGRPSGLSQAAKFFGLDEHNPAHRVFLLHALTDAAFGADPKERPVGAKTWDKGKLAILGLRAFGPKGCADGLKGNAAAKKIKETFKEEYRHVSAETIRQRLPAAKEAFGEFSAILLSRMEATGLSLSEYIALLKREMSKDGRDTVEYLRPRFSLQHGESSQRYLLLTGSACA